MKSSKLPEFSPALYGPAPFYKRKFSCMAILLLLGALIGGIIAWLLAPRGQQDCVYGPPPIEKPEPTVYGPPPIEEPQPSILLKRQSQNRYIETRP